MTDNVDTTGDEPLHDPLTNIPDTGDAVGRDGVDPEPDEITDPGDPSFVEPDPSVTPIEDAEPTAIPRGAPRVRGAVYVGYQPAARCTSGPQPGARALMSWFLSAYGRLGGVNTGIYNCRTVRGGSTTSLHGEGRACDLGIRPYSAGYGTALAERLRLNSAELGIQLIIWNRRIWSGARPTQGWRPYSGVSAHTDHLHVELSWRTARDAPLTVERINAVLNPPPPPRPTPTPGTFGRVLRLTEPHMQGADVGAVQRVLRAWYGLPAGWVDEDYGPATVDYVKRAQRGTPPPPVLDDDGEVGPMTLRKLGLIR